MKQKIILDKLQELSEKNERLYKKKTEFEQEILSLDIQIYNLMGEYEKLVKSLNFK